MWHHQNSSWTFSYQNMGLTTITPDEALALVDHSLICDFNVLRLTGELLYKTLQVYIYIFAFQIL